VKRKPHCAQDVKRVHDQVAVCAWCEGSFTIKGSKIKDRSRGKAGPFCSSKCIGKYGASVQNGGKELALDKVEREYYRLKNDRTSD